MGDNRTLINKIITGSWKVKLSVLLMGAGQIAYGCIGKGLIFVITEILMLKYFFSKGFAGIKGFFTLGTQKADAWAGTAGDNSIVMLLMGIWQHLYIFIL